MNDEKKCRCVCHTVGLFGLNCCECTRKALDEFVNGRPVMASPEPPPAEPLECGRCNMPITGKPWCLCHRCGVPLCGITCEEWHLEKDCEGTGEEDGSRPSAPALLEEARRWWPKHRDDFVSAVYGTGLATHPIYDIESVLAAFAAHVQKGKP